MDLKADRKRQLLEKAQELARDIAAGGATRSEWRHVLDGLYLAPGDPELLKARTQELLAALPESGLIGRSRKTESQLTHVGAIFGRVLREGHSDPELRFLLGWATRILASEEKKRDRTARAKGRHGSGSRPRRDRRTGQAPVKPKPPPAPRAPEKEVWPEATVSYNAGGGGIVRAVAADRRTAEARQEDARKLIATLNDEARKRLKKRSLRLEVQVEKIGKAWHLLAIRR